MRDADLSRAGASAAAPRSASHTSSFARAAATLSRVVRVVSAASAADPSHARGKDYGAIAYSTDGIGRPLCGSLPMLVEQRCWASRRRRCDSLVARSDDTSARSRCLPGPATRTPSTSRVAPTTASRMRLTGPPVGPPMPRPLRTPPGHE
jgi:hypothetical protein